MREIPSYFDRKNDNVFNRGQVAMKKAKKSEMGKITREGDTWMKRRPDQRKKRTTLW